MTVHTPPPSPELADIMIGMGHRARAASKAMGLLTAPDRTRALVAIAAAIRAAAPEILAANAEDMANARAKGLSGAMLDRLALDEKRLEGIAAGVETVAALPDPIGRELARWTRPNGLDIARIAVPLGVIGIIYESRPNVTVDAGVLCLRSGNAAILRGGSESARTSHALADAMRGALKNEEMPVDAIQLVATTDREAVGHMLAGLDGTLDVIVPRGGRSLVERVQAEARVPVIGHLEGLCHTYVHSAADPVKAVEITLNAKMRRTGVCGSTETLLIDASVAPSLLPQIAAALTAAGCELRGDTRAREILADIKPATEEDWATEYLDAILAIAVVDDLDDALAHLARWSSGHTDAIITEDQTAADTFIAQVDSAIVLHNASTQFADGGEFGFGAEIGIATGRIHARGPVGAEQLTTYKYAVRGTGQVRP
ncbi:glutamate-5-semialdehyde dehydrogenase [Hyphomonas sp. WL0036]|uniref:glutamate-5-semialdehyde dehydrogenase n=1 Tax=Hyphomonas sediminis TaxID=2866160 RepID=UPI001C821335|nr:glutamate-5-semialdehyde dehydrogenase [Hyphomonas sediminis]MBY9066058.1 glutamate-5-semialdehyde dehydrogenase [Hyphomonas sediminis]